jgi:hypothetical protein
LDGKHFGGLLDEVQNPEWAVAGGLALGFDAFANSRAISGRAFRLAQSCRVV